MGADVCGVELVTSRRIKFVEFYRFSDRTLEEPLS